MLVTHLIWFSFIKKRKIRGGVFHVFKERTWHFFNCTDMSKMQKHLGVCQNIT
uniref:Uncharacterized protein n=1 Tax=Arundo donax TaxID=35708 RepID=A0A0A9BI83_ARUDO